ncbi:MAG: response regulator, partial [Desulfuromonadales bacterium]
MKPDKVLIVDDDKFIRTILKDALAGRYTTLEADNGQTALDMVFSTLPDLVILDIEMPVMNGIEVCRIIKETEQTKRIPVILITAHTNRDEIILGMQTGADDYITKPVHPPEVLARVDAHLLYKNYYNELERR